MDSFFAFAQNNYDFFLILHLFAMVLGLGGATYSDILLFRFLKDWEMDEKEVEVIETMAKVILIGIVLAFISGLMIFLPKAEELLQTPKFLLKNLVFIVLVINGWVLHKAILPKMIHFSFKKNHYICGSKCFHLRHASFICGAISVVSWYTVFLIGGIRTLPFTFEFLLGGYLVLLVGAIGGALFTEKFLWNKSHKGKK